MYNNKTNKRIGAKKVSFFIICLEILVQFLILFYVNNAGLTKYLLLTLFFLVIILCLIEFRKIIITNLALMTTIIVLMIISTLMGSGGWGAIVNAVILMVNMLVLSQMKFSYKQIRIVSYIFLLPIITLLLFSNKYYVHYVSSNIFDYTLNPNVIAYLILLGSFFAFHLINNKRTAIKSFIAFIVALYLLIGTGARTSLLAFVLFVILNLLYKRKQFRKIKLAKYKSRIALMIMVSFAIIYIYAYVLPSYVTGNSLIILNKNLFSGRQVIWQEIFSLMKHSWLFGVGADYAFMDNRLYSAHNLFLGYASMFGVPVMLGMVIYIYKILKDCFLKNNNKNTKYLFSIWVALLVVSMFETVLSYSPIIIFTTCVFIFNLDSGHGKEGLQNDP
ncbi:O-antigen ligase family protein [Syntrophomonas erecta]